MQPIVGLAIGKQDLYYATSSSSTEGQIRRMPIGGGASTEVVSGAQPRGLFLNEDVLYFITDSTDDRVSTLWAESVAGGRPAVVAVDTRISNFVIDTSSIYFHASPAPSGVGHIARVPKTSSDASTPEMVVETLNSWGFTIDATNVYWTKYDGAEGTLFQRPLKGGATTTLATASKEIIAQPTVAGDYVYFTYLGTPATCRGAIMRVPTTGGTVERLSPGNTGAASNVSRVSVDDPFIYWSQIWYSGRILRALKSGGVPEVVVADQLNLGYVVATATHVYWAARSSLSGPYEIRVVAR
jgi:Domain of unknown function (DUF5050)